MAVCPETESNCQDDSTLAESGVLLSDAGECAAAAALSFALNGVSESALCADSWTWMSDLA